MATTIDSRFVQEFDVVLRGAFGGIPLSDSSSIERYYQLRYNKPLDYTPFGVTNIQDLLFKLCEQNKVLLLQNPETKETHVMSASLAEAQQKGFLKCNVEELLEKYGGEIAFSSFEDFYKDTFKDEWDSLYFGLTGLDQLCDVYKDILTVEVNSSGEKVMKVVSKVFSEQAAVTREIEDILERCPRGIPMSNLSCIEGTYQLMHGKPLDYKSFGVKNIRELFLKLGKKKKVVLKRTESEIYVMSLRLAELQHKGKLKLIVEILLDLYGGEIPFCSFVRCYEYRFKVEWNPLYYGLTDLDRLCDFLKDTVMVEVNSSGEKVIKAVNKRSSG